MTDLATILAALRRPKILVRAARAGVVDYRRERDLKRILRLAARPPPPAQAIGTCSPRRAASRTTRAAGEATYSIQRHVAVLTAILAEARLMPARRARLTPTEPQRSGGRSPLAIPAREVLVPAVSGRLIIASNRIASPGEPRPGGLAVALADALAERGGGVWFGWSGETVERETRGVRLFADGNVDYALADLTEAEYAGYYLGYSNRALWPVFHYRVDLAHFDEAEFEAYEGVNRRFGRLLAQFTRAGRHLWVHDYHFLLMGQELRASGWEGRWASSSTSPSRPRRSSPPSPSTSASPAASAPSTSSASRPRATPRTSAATSSRVRRRSRTRTAASASSTGPSPPRPSRSASIPTTSPPSPTSEEGRGRRRAARADHREPRARHRRRPHGLFQGPAAADGSLRADARRPRRAPRQRQLPADRAASREAVDAYQVLREELDRLAGRINGDYADLDWMPIRYLARSYSRGTSPASTASPASASSRRSTTA